MSLTASADITASFTNFQQTKSNKFMRSGPASHFAKSDLSQVALKLPVICPPVRLALLYGFPDKKGLLLAALMQY
eukprot:1156720-Pelagomonas_calceolata.AAC.7